MSLARARRRAPARLLLLYTGSGAGAQGLAHRLSLAPGMLDGTAAAATMPWEPLIKPLFDLLYTLVGRSQDAHARAKAERELGEVVRELLHESPNLTRAEFRIAAARALGITSEDLIRAEEMLAQVRSAEKRRRREAKRPAPRPPRRKGGTG